MKDNFSNNSPNYSRYRPTYPDELIQYLVTLVKNRGVLWDCGTGNGQLAAALAPYFDRVEATDISLEQMAGAKQLQNVFYSRAPAEKTEFPGSYFDLVTVAQAVHWFNFEEFYREVRRVLKTNGILCVTGYGLLRANPETNRIIDHFYNNIIGPYWDPERKYLEEEYTTIPFPFKKIETSGFVINYTWSLEQLMEYLRSWSAVNHFQKAEQFDPVKEIEAPLRERFGKEGEVTFPVLLRVGRN